MQNHVEIDTFICSGLLEVQVFSYAVETEHLIIICVFDQLENYRTLLHGFKSPPSRHVGRKHVFGILIYAYTKSRFSYDAAHMITVKRNDLLQIINYSKNGCLFSVHHIET